MIVVLLLAVLLFDMGRPRQHIWRETYEWKGTHPHDLKILLSEIPKAKQWDTVIVATESFYEWYQSPDYDSSIQDYLLLFVGSSISLDELSKESLHRFVEKGNDAFIFAKNGTIHYTDSTAFSWYQNHYVQDRKWEIKLYGQEESYSMEKLFSESYGYADDDIPLEKLGYIHEYVDEDTNINFYSIPYGKGRYFMHSNPIILTNYHLLNGSKEYVNKVFSVSSKNKIIILAGKGFDAGEKHLLDLIFSSRSLTWAWYLALFVLALYLFFYAKRKQQVIPIIQPLENTTEQFVQTVGNMYYKSGNYTSIVHKRIVYFLEYIRSKYHIDTQALSPEILKLIAARSGVAIERVDILFEAVERYRRQSSISKEDCIHLDRLMENFKTEEHNIQKTL